MFPKKDLHEQGHNARAETNLDGSSGSGLKSEPGISVVICCYNSGQIIGKTLGYLSAQEISSDFSIEVILVDNASTDNTLEVAGKSWTTLPASQNPSFTFRMVSEPRPGLSYARLKGSKEATYPYILFCDDDNFLAIDYCATAYEIMYSDPVIGACGGCGKPVYEGEMPEWFKSLQISYAWGPQTDGEGYTKSYTLYGAGLVIRKSILENLIEANYQPVLQDRSGKQLTSGGDEELTMWCKILGYQLYYTARLKFDHLIKPGRFTIDYLIRYYKAIGISLAKQIPLQIILFDQESTYKSRWDFQVCKWIIVGLQNGIKPGRTLLHFRLDYIANKYRIITLISGKSDFINKLDYLRAFKNGLVAARGSALIHAQ